MRIQPPSALLMGAPGSGKTSSIATLLEAGIEVFTIVTEPGGAESLVDWTRNKGYDMNKLHFAEALPTTKGWDAIDEMTKNIGAMDFEALSKQKQGIGKSQTRDAAMNFLNLLKNFKCGRTGKEYGDFTSFTDKQAIVVDSLTGLSTMAWYLTVGYKPTGAPGEWNVAQNWLSSIILKINSDRSCYFVLTAHIEKEPNEITGVNQIMVSTLGKKLAPKIPVNFSEVIYAQRTKEGNNNVFKWSTVDSQVDLKNRALPVSDKLPPSFVPVVQAYENRKKIASLTSQSAA